MIREAGKLAETDATCQRRQSPLRPRPPKSQGRVPPQLLLLPFHPSALRHDDATPERPCSHPDLFEEPLLALTLIYSLSCHPDHAFYSAVTIYSYFCLFVCLSIICQFRQNINDTRARSGLFPSSCLAGTVPGT